MAKYFNHLIISAAALALLISVLCARAQDCHTKPQDCNATQVLYDLVVYDTVVTSDPQPPTYCERYQRTSLSQNGISAEYNFVYTTAPGNSTPIQDKCVWEVANGTLFVVRCADYTSFVYLVTLDYVNEDHCFVCHCNIDENYQDQYYYVVSNPDSSESDFEKCLRKFEDYSGGNVTYMRAPGLCPTIPPKPE